MDSKLLAATLHSKEPLRGGGRGDGKDALSLPEQPQWPSWHTFQSVT
jgi:hypothetical protein